MYSGILLSLAASALAARPFLNEPDTGLEQFLGADFPVGQLPNITDIVGLPDFDWAARNYMNTTAYTYYRNGAAGEWSYRNNLEVFHRFRLRPRMMVDVLDIESTLPTTILGYNVSAPFFIAPCARACYAHEDGELGLIKGAVAGNILYMPSLYACKTIEEIAAARANATTGLTFQQLYVTSNDTAVKIDMDRAKAAGSKAIVLTIDSAADGNRHRAVRFGVGSADSEMTLITWEYWHKLQNMTTLPVILKGIQTVDDAKRAVKEGVKAIYLSNHGGRQLDGSPSSLEVALEIYQNAPEVFQQIEVYADGGVRYGADALKLLALGVKAVGLGRPFMYSNVYGEEGVKHAIDIMKKELLLDAANMGVADIHKINASYMVWQNNGWYS